MNDAGHAGRLGRLVVAFKNSKGDHEEWLQACVSAVLVALSPLAYIPFRKEEEEKGRRGRGKNKKYREARGSKGDKATKVHIFFLKSIGCVVAFAKSEGDQGDHNATMGYICR